MDMVAQLKMTFDYKKPWKDLASLPISLLIWNIMQNHGTWNSRPKKENFLLSSFTFARNWFWLRFFFFSIATGGRWRGRHDDGRVRAAIWTPSDARYLFLIALPLQVNGRYNHLKIVNITEERGGGGTYTRMSNHSSVGENQFGRSPPIYQCWAWWGIYSYPHTHTHTRSLHTRNSYKVHMKRWRRRRNFFLPPALWWIGPVKSNGL